MPGSDGEQPNQRWSLRHLRCKQFQLHDIYILWYQISCLPYVVVAFFGSVTAQVALIVAVLSFSDSGAKLQGGFNRGCPMTLVRCTS